MLTQTLQGTAFNAGIGVGTAVIHRPRVWKELTLSSDTRQESERLKMAIRSMIDSIDRLVESTPLVEKATHDVLASYRMIAADTKWVKRIQHYIQKGFTAEAAVQKVRRYIRERYTHMGNPTLKERLSDLEDLASRLLRHLTGEHTSPQPLPETAILIAHTLGPAELLDYDRRSIKGVVLEEGVHTAHVAIVARALDIPIIGRVPFLLTHVGAGDKLIVDAEEGNITIHPSPDAIQKAREKIGHLKKAQTLHKKLYDKPCKTLDGISIKLSLNAGLPVDLHHLNNYNLEGIGLYRTEIPFMLRTTFPNVNIQTEIYQEVLDQAGDRPVTFRTLDIGGDKIIPYMWKTSDENPLLGWRGIRVSLDKISFFSQQIQALLRAAHGKELHLLFPFVSEFTEYLQAREFVEHEWKHAQDKGLPLPTALHCGVMMEVPSLVSELHHFSDKVDFISVGTNDLFQCFYACDRTNPILSNRYDTLSSAFLKYLQEIFQTCHKAKIPVHVCGEMASHPLDAMALLALGYRSLSLSVPAVGPLKQMILKLPLKKTETFLKHALETYSPSLRPQLQAFANKNGIPL